MPHETAVFRALEELANEMTVLTSVRVPAGVRDAAKVLAEAGIIDSFNDLLVQGARDRIDALLQQAALETYFNAHPEFRPTLSEVAQAMAAIDGDDQLAQHPAVVDQAARELVERKPDATADDVLAYAAALVRHAAS